MLSRFGYRDSWTKSFHSPLGCPITRRATQPKQQSEEDSNFLPLLGRSGFSSSISGCAVLPSDMCRAEGSEKKSSQKIPKLHPFEIFFSTLRNVVETSAMAPCSFPLTLATVGARPRRSFEEINFSEADNTNHRPSS